MAYSYDRTASTVNLRDLSQKFYQGLKKAIEAETNRKAKDALKDALGKFEEVIDLLKVAQHEADESTREASFDVDAAIDGLNLRGRDAFFTHLITQEAMMWYPMVLRGEERHIASEVEPLAQRRGFNEQERRDLQRLANLLIVNADEIRQAARKTYG